MAVLYKFAVFLALLCSVAINSSAKRAYGNDVTNDFSLGNLLFDAITGELQLPQSGGLETLDECTAIYTVQNVEILIIAGIKIRQCSNVDEGLLQNYLQQRHAASVKATFQQQVLACSTRKCYADQVMQLFYAVSPMQRNFWQTERCVIHEIGKTLRDLQAATVSLENCLSKDINTSPPWNETTPNWNFTTPSWNETTPTPNWNETTPDWNVTTTTPNWNVTTPSWNETTPTPNWNETTPSWNFTTPSWNQTTINPNWNETTINPAWNETTLNWNTTTPSWNETTLRPEWNNTTPNWNQTTLGPNWNETTTEVPTTTTTASWWDKLLHDIGL